MKNPIRNGTMIALAAAGLFTTGCKKKEEASSNKPPAATPAAPDKDTAAPTPDKPADKTAKVHCQGINECKGKGGCKSADNACAGQNGCKGKSFAEVDSDEDCKTKGGTVIEATM